MAKSFQDQAEVGAFVPTTDIWDPSEIFSTEVTSPEFKELLVRLYQNLNRMSLVLNIKESGYYALEEFVTGNIYFPNPSLDSTTAQVPEWRPDFRKVINFGALPNNSTKSIPHGITWTSDFSSTHIYGSSTNPGVNMIPLPFASPVLSENIKIDIDTTNVNITTGSDRTSYTRTTVVLMFIKS